MSVTRSYRSARVAGLALALTAPLVVATATPGFASGESTSASLTAPTSGSAPSSSFSWNYTFNLNGGHGLSNVAVGFCSADILADVVSASPSAEVFTSGDVPGGHTGFGPGVKFDVTATTGTLTVTFANPHAISATGLRVQSHSGDGKTPDTVTVAPGPGPCPADSVTTGGTTGSGTTGGTSDSGTTGGTSDSGTTGGTSGDRGTNGDSGTNPSGGTNAPSNPVTPATNDPAPTLAIATDPAPTTTAVAPASDVNAAPTTTGSPTVVLGEHIDQPAPAVAPSGLLAHTGTDHLVPLVGLALSLLAAGLALMAGFRRRIRSASSAG
jgi:hypothetical protein